jgi:hypothetical protein
MAFGGGQLWRPYTGQNLGNKDYSAAFPANDFAARVAGALMSRFNTDWDKQNSANDVKLANQGIAAGSEAYGADKDALNRARNDARHPNPSLPAVRSSRGCSGSTAGCWPGSPIKAQEQQYGQNYQNANLNNQARQQGSANSSLSAISR